MTSIYYKMCIKNIYIYTYLCTRTINTIFWQPTKFHHHPISLMYPSNAGSRLPRLAARASPAWRLSILKIPLFELTKKMMKLKFIKNSKMIQIQYVHNHCPQKNPSRSNPFRVWLYIYTHLYVYMYIYIYVYIYISILHVPADIELEWFTQGMVNPLSNIQNSLNKWHVCCVNSAK